MKAIVYTKYGSPDVFTLKEVEKPTPKDNEVLVKVHASSVNAADLDQLKGVFLIRLAGLLRPKYKILGSDIAGRVEAVGKNAKQFQPGDEVYGDITACGFGAFAEYVCVPENTLALKPTNLTFEEAATVPSAGVIALQGIRDKRQIQPGQKVLINGAGGSVGPFAIQMAKNFGAEVTAVDSTSKLDMLRSIGADQVIDYTQEDFTKSGQRYDLILDNVAYRSVFKYSRVLKPKGICVIVGGSLGPIFQAVFLGPLISLFRKKKIGILIWKQSQKDLVSLKELLESGKLVPVIDRCYPLSEVAEAFRHFIDGQPKGKVVITIDHKNKI